jgi:hypothetical protein
VRSPLEFVGAHAWQRAVFTTYSLRLSFFESAVLDQLVRGGASNALILADVDGVRGALSEQGARRAGKEYDIEPIAVTTGARARGKAILRLKVVLEDGGWTLTPGVSRGSFPLPTAGRLRTAISLAHECGLIHRVEI